MANKLDTILAHAVQNKLNVLLVGKHGVGKTALVKQCFEEAGLKWKYYSASTMDPWVDFIGVPKEKTDNDGNVYLDLVRPKELVCDEVEAMFFDELNRSPKKIRNAIMELIQFKTINGKRFNNLKIIWAAINPDDEANTYDVEKLDPAQMDRFQIKIDVPYDVDERFFKRVYGDRGVRACKWWRSLDVAAREAVSPRRLDYAVQVLDSGGDVRYVLDQKVNVTSFIETLSKGDPVEICNNLLSKTPDEIRAELMKNNTYSHIRSQMLADDRMIRGLARYLPSEVLLKELMPRAGNHDNKRLISCVANNTDMFDAISESILGNVNAYPEAIKMAFQAHRDHKAKAERNGLAVSQDMLSKLRQEKQRAPANTIMVNGLQHNVSDLTVDNFSTKTGRNFRVTALQAKAIADGKMTRADAFKEYIQTLLNQQNSSN